MPIRNRRRTEEDTETIRYEWPLMGSSERARVLDDLDEDIHVTTTHNPDGTTTIASIDPVPDTPVVEESQLFSNPNNRKFPFSIVILEKRLKLYSELNNSNAWRDYLIGDNDIKESMLHTIAGSAYAKYDLITDKDDVILYEDSSITIKREDSILIPHLGYFKKDDPRIITDCLNPKFLVINDPKYAKFQYEVFTGIDENGELICKDTYTTVPSGLNNKLPVLKISNKITGKLNLCYFVPSLLENPLFNNIYKEDLNTGIFWHYKNVPSFTKKAKITYRKYKGRTGEFINSIEGTPNTFISTLGKKYFYGIEIETVSGILPHYLDDILYYSAVHDGSLKDLDDNVTYGGEYITDILIGDKGLKQLKKLCFELSRRCLIDKRCGVHVHLSNIDFTKENIILMYAVYYQIQEEIFAMLPKSRRDNVYCRYLDNLGIIVNNINPMNTQRSFYIDKYYNDIIAYLAQKDTTDTYINKKKDHPKGPKCGYDHSTARYCWANFIPAVFDTRRSSKPVPGLEGHYTNPVQTIEFRPMQASTSYIKIKNWLLICFALVDIIENHKQEIYSTDISKIDLLFILKNCYPKDYDKLYDYVVERKKKFESGNVKTEIEDYQDNEIDNNFKMKNL